MNCGGDVVSAGKRVKKNKMYPRHSRPVFPNLLLLWTPSDFVSFLFPPHTHTHAAFYPVYMIFTCGLLGIERAIGHQLIKAAQCYERLFLFPNFPLFLRVSKAQKIWSAGPHTRKACVLLISYTPVYNSSFSYLRQGAQQLHNPFLYHWTDSALHTPFL